VSGRVGEWASRWVGDTGSGSATLRQAQAQRLATQPPTQRAPSALSGRPACPPSAQRLPASAQPPSAQPACQRRLRVPSLPATQRPAPSHPAQRLRAPESAQPACPGLLTHPARSRALSGRSARCIPVPMPMPVPIAHRIRIRISMPRQHSDTRCPATRLRLTASASASKRMAHKGTGLPAYGLERLTASRIRTTQTARILLRGSGP
jgi:hypothetical protein